MLNRMALGVFFAIGGYLKLFNSSRHATLAQTFQDGYSEPCITVMGLGTIGDPTGCTNRSICRADMWMPPVSSKCSSAF